MLRSAILCAQVDDSGPRLLPADAQPYTGACPPSDDWVQVAGDCDDAAPDAHPAATERCDGDDDDCDGVVDEGCDDTPTDETPPTDDETPPADPAEGDAKGGCGCDHSGPSGAAWLASLIALAAARRRPVRRSQVPA